MAACRKNPDYTYAYFTLIKAAVSPAVGRKL